MVIACSFTYTCVFLGGPHREGLSQRRRQELLQMWKRGPHQPRVRRTGRQLTYQVLLSVPLEHASYYGHDKSS